MQEIVVISGLGSLGLAGALHYSRKKAELRLGDLNESRLVKLGELKQIADGVAEEMGRGAWSEYVKVVGKVTTKKPLIAPLSKRPCVQFCVKVVREYEYEEEYRDSDGHERCRTVKGSQTMSDYDQQMPFFVQDRSGVARVRPAGADVETICSIDDFQRDDCHYGGFKMLNASRGHHNHATTLGYRYTERILPLDAEVLIVGQAHDAADGLEIRKPTKVDDAMFISLKTEDQLRREAASSAGFAKKGSVAAAALGVVVVLFGLVTSPSPHHDDGGSHRREHRRH